MKKLFRFLFLIILAITIGVVWLLFGSSTHFNESKKNFYIHTGSSFNDVVHGLEEQNILSGTALFTKLAAVTGYNDNTVKPGRYVISNGASLFSILRKLKSGGQTTVDLVITKLRTKEDLAKKIAANFECDSANVMKFLNSNDSLTTYDLDSNTVMTAVFPNTYNLFWNTSFSRIFKKLFTEHERFWTDERKKQAAAKGLTMVQAYTLASIIEEETRFDEEKSKIAGVYLNRIKTNMKLQADPTIKFALKDFTLKRIYDGHINRSAESPYNTYTHLGLPPGPICTPSIKTIDIVLNAPATDYLYFVAQPNNSGLSNFASTYQQHSIYAKMYQRYLDSINIK
ncbi:endolytic transglycosylase MltG [Ferruginibacter albus]|uniref:endolytic transglycosylase MltG n=1 Tax=Ferruginibacter albus TaxID=2875540 RepID=UPI001CC6A86C|nr:endolytic transglycosylase MltG [Ferruginibacter albus]UAY51054.1 endolytic transglycosylase MltG [Ferruginibacter albus]